MRKSIPIIVMFWSGIVSAKNIFKFPTLTAQDTKSRGVVEKNLPDITEVQHSQFSITIPKGWSLNPVGPSEKDKISLTATPSDNIEMDETYLGVQVRSAPPAETLEQKKLKHERLGRKTSYQSWNGKTWLLVEYVSENSAKKQQKSWAAFTFYEDTEFWLIAGTPITKLPSMEKQLREIMASVSIH